MNSLIQMGLDRSFLCIQPRLELRNPQPSSISVMLNLLLVSRELDGSSLEFVSVSRKIELRFMMLLFNIKLNIKLLGWFKCS